MRFLTSVVIFAATVSALPIISDISNSPAPELTTPGTENSFDKNAMTPHIAATADVADGPNWNYGPPGPPNGGYNYNSGPGYGPPRPREPERAGGALESIGYGLGSAIGTPVGWIGDLVGGAGSGLYNGIRGGYKMIKG